MSKITKYILSIALLLNFIFTADPNWEDDVNTGAEFSATLANAIVVIDGVAKQTGKLAAFADGEVIGVDASGAVFFPPTQAYLWEASLYSDDVAAGTVSANKAVIVDGNSDISGFRNITATGTITANSIKTNTLTDSNGDRFLYKDTINDIVHIGSDSMLFYDSSTYGKDIMASSTGNIQIGKNATDSTTVIGDLIIQEPNEANHAATRKYADQVSLMATTLDTRLPLYGNKHSLNLSSASTNNEIAFGLNFVGIYDGLHLPMDFSLGSAVSGDYNMGKFSLGMSW